LVEVQALTFDAAQAASELLRDEVAVHLQAAASRLQDAVLNVLWLSDSGYFALGARPPTRSDRYEPLSVAGSNMGHLLDSQLLADPQCVEIRQRTIEKLFTPEML
jgi:glycogen debranching enzyme